MAREGSYPREGADHAGGYPRESGFPREFPRERGFGHVPGQRWAGGYGGDVDRGLIAMGRGFSGSHFGPPSQSRPGSNLEHEQLLRGGQRHFGTDVDRGVPLGSNLEHEQLLRGSGYGSQGTDMGMGAPDDDRGPHYGKGPKGYKRSDARTHDEVCEAIAHQGHIDASDVQVKVESGIVTLTGTVTHREDKRGLEHLVERLRGVDEVRNELRLKRRAAGEEAGPKSSRGAERQSPASSVAASSPGNGGDPKDQKNGNSARG